MNIHLELIWPMAGMVLLVSIVLLIMFRTRVVAVLSKRVPISYFKTYSSPMDDDMVLRTQRHFANLFETPVLFYAACVAGMLAPVHLQTYLATAWVYVAIRAAHAWVHLGSNNIRLRMVVYFTSWICIWALWIQLVVAVAHAT